MLLSDLFETLSYGHLANLSIGGSGDGTIPVASQPRIINLVNQGLLDLYSRFSLRENEVIVRTYEGISIYHLHNDYADSTDTVVAQKYIDDDVGSPFANDVIKILGIFDAEGVEIPVNDSGDPLSIFTPTLDSIQIPAPIDGSVISVIYQARHSRLETGDLNQEIKLPKPLVNALATWVGAKIYGGMAGQEASAKAMELSLAYETLCQGVILNDLVSSSLVDTNTKLMTRGFK